MPKTGNQIAQWKAKTGDPRSVKEIKADIAHKRAFIKDTLWPTLISYCKTRFDLKDLLNVTVAMLDQANQQEMLNKNKKQSAAPVEELPLLPAHKTEDYLKERAVLDLFKGYSLQDTKGLLEGLVGEMMGWQKKEDKELGVETIKAEFLE